MFGVTIPIDTSFVELPPKFIGTLLLLGAMKDFQINDSRLKKAFYILTGMFLLQSILFISWTTSLVYPNNFERGFISIIGCIAHFGSIYVAIKLIEKIQEKTQVNLSTKALKFVACILLILCITEYHVLALSPIVGLLVWRQIVLITACMFVYRCYKALRHIKLNT